MIILRMSSKVVGQLKTIFMSKNIEQGCILGCSGEFDYIDTCCQIPSVQESPYYYEPDSYRANQIIEIWRQSGVCFCGFIHSHVIDQPEFSLEDLNFAKKLCSAFPLSYIWFGLAVRKKDSDISFYFYAASLDKNDNLILQSTQFVLQ